MKRGNFHYNSNEKEEENNDNNNKESNINYDRSNMKNNFDVNNVIKNEFSEHKKSIISVSENSNRVKIDDNNNNKSSSRNFLRNDYNKDSLISQSKDELHLSQNISKIINNQNHRLDIDFESNFFSNHKQNNNLNNTNDSNVTNNLINNISNKKKKKKNNNSINNNNSNIRNQTKKINNLYENISNFNDNNSSKDNSTNQINNSIKIINVSKIENLKANNNGIQLKDNNQSKCSSSIKTNQNKDKIIPPLILNSLKQPIDLNPTNNKNSKDESKINESPPEKTEEEKEKEEINEMESIKVDIIEEKLNKIKQEDEFQIIENRPLNIENNFFSCLCQYFKNREIFCITYFNEQNTTPKFIRRSSLFFCLTFIFTINCIFYDESLVDKRYQNILKDESNNNGISYFFKNEFKISIYSALIGNLFKIFFIKIIINWIFKFDKKIRIMMSVTFEEKLKENEKIELNEKRETLIKCYIIKVKIYFGIIILLNLFIAYICICYGAFFEKSYSFFILSFLLSYAFSIIFCYCFCFVIILIYKIWKKTNNLIAIALFILLSKLY